MGKSENQPKESQLKSSFSRGHGKNTQKIQIVTLQIV